MQPIYMAAFTGLALGLWTPASAQENADVNGDGLLTIQEVQAVMPEVDADQFSTMDVNGDGALDGDELAAAQAAGLLPKSEG